MAISNLIPRHTMKNRTRQRSMKDRLDYDEKPTKTNNGELYVRPGIRRRRI